MVLPTDIESGDTGHAGIHNDTNEAVNDLESSKDDKAKTINAQTGTSYTAVLADAGEIVTMTNAGASTFSAPQNSAAAIPVGSEIEVIQLGAGQVTINAGSGATVNAQGGNLKITGQYGVARLRKVSTNGWIASGDLSA